MNTRAEMLRQATYNRLILKSSKSSIVICPGISIVLSNDGIDEFAKTSPAELHRYFTGYKDPSMHALAIDTFLRQLAELASFLGEHSSKDKFYNFDGFEGLRYQKCSGGKIETTLSVSLNSGKSIGDESKVLSDIRGFLGACCSFALWNPIDEKPGDGPTDTADFFERCYLNHRDKDFRLFNTKKSYYYMEANNLVTFKVLDWVSRGYNSYSDYNLAVTAGYDDVDWKILAECTVFSNHALGVVAYLTGDYTLI